MAVRRHSGDSIKIEGSEPSSLLSALGIEPPAWMGDALCAQVGGDEIFFPEKGGSTREAKAVCRRCPVQVECLDYALANDERFGIWGGVSERDRRRLSRGARTPPPYDLPCGNPGCDEMFNHRGHRGRHLLVCPFRASETQQEPA